MRGNGNPVAHLRQDESGKWTEHELSDHLTTVAMNAAAFASDFGNADWAYVAGMLHDLGKFNPDWQEYLRRNNGEYSEEGLDGQD